MPLPLPLPLTGRLFGVLNINKRPNVTSRDVVNVVQRLVRPAKCGHAGTLDPMATGVLLVCVGPATRLMDLLHRNSKVYRAEFRLGARSDTDDSTGQIQEVEINSTVPTASQVTAQLQTMVGLIQQIPPAFSAVHVEGKRAYALARRGEQVVLQPRTVHIHRISLLSYSWPLLSLEIECGSGTYIRSIARDLGNQLGCGGLMTELQRTSIGQFSIVDAVDPEQLTINTLSEHLQTATQITADLPQYRCSSQDTAALKCGKKLSVDDQRLLRTEMFPSSLNSGITAALTDMQGDELLALAELSINRRELQPKIGFC